MAYHEYIQSQALLTGKGEVDPPFYALIMAAMRKADTRNLNMLKAAFPGVWKELEARYKAPDGFLSKVECLGEKGDVYTEAMIEGVPFPQEGWPQDDYP